MNEATDLMTNVEREPSLGSGWVDAHADYLFNFAIGQVRDANTAEDLVQDTFLAAVKAQNSFGGKSSARTWLVGVLRHKIYDHLRKTCRERAVRHDPTPMNDEESWEESARWLHDMAADLGAREAPGDTSLPSPLDSTSSRPQQLDAMRSRSGAHTEYAEDEITAHRRAHQRIDRAERGRHRCDRGSGHGLCRLA